MNRLAAILLLILAGCSTKPAATPLPSPALVAKLNADIAFVTPKAQAMPRATVSIPFRHPPVPPAPPFTKTLLGWSPNYTNDLEYTVVMCSTNMKDWFPVWVGRGSTTIVSNLWPFASFKAFNSIASDSNSIPN